MLRLSPVTHDTCALSVLQVQGLSPPRDCGFGFLGPISVFYEYGKGGEVIPSPPPPQVHHKSVPSDLDLGVSLSTLCKFLTGKVRVTKTQAGEGQWACKSVLEAVETCCCYFNDDDVRALPFLHPLISPCWGHSDTAPSPQHPQAS